MIVVSSQIMLSFGLMPISLILSMSMFGRLLISSRQTQMMREISVLLMLVVALIILVVDLVVLGSMCPYKVFVVFSRDPSWGTCASS